MLMVLGRLDEAEPYLRQAYEGRRKLSGDEHPETLITMNAIARLLKKRGNLTEAEPMLCDSLAKFRRVLGDGHPNTINAILNHADVLRVMSKFTEAEPLYREAVERTQAVFGKDHVRMGSARLMLAALLRDQKRFAEAEDELLEAHRIFVVATGAPPGYRLDAMRTLAKLYTAWDLVEPDKGHATQAADWQLKLAATSKPATTTSSTK